MSVGKVVEYAAAEVAAVAAAGSTVAIALTADTVAAAAGEEGVGAVAEVTAPRALIGRVHMSAAFRMPGFTFSTTRSSAGKSFGCRHADEDRGGRL